MFEGGRGGGSERKERDLHEAMCGTDHPARTDETATTQVSVIASPVLPVDGCKPRLVLNSGEFSPNNLKAGPQSLLAALKLQLTGSRGRPFS